MSTKLYTTLATALFLSVCFTQSGCVVTGDDANSKGEASEHVITDSAITTAIKTKYLTDPHIKVLDIHVKTVSGHVTLSGFVPTEDAKKLAITLARDTEGVKGVTSHLNTKRKK